MDEARTYRGRLAPSPTGLLHVGHARTFLLAWVRARRARGALVLRLEDLDPPRIVPGAAEAIVRDLRWLGLDWDEGPDAGGPHGPYVQSERGAFYERALGRLRELGLVYPCTCSRKEVALASSAPHDDDARGLAYPGTCRSGPTHPERTAVALRYREGDFVVRRADGLWAYQLAVSVDDGEMGITEVVRGADLESSTPWQRSILRALGHAPPAYVHAPLAYGPDGARLSKRNGARTLADLRDGGTRPEELIGRLAAELGLIDAARPLSPRELAT